MAKEDESFEKIIGNFLLDWTSDTSTVKVQTSGSTGNPKTIVLKKEHMVNSALATGAYFGLQPKQNALLCLPCTGIAGKMMLVRAMVLGLHLDYTEPSSNPMSSNNQVYDFVAMVPLQVQNSLDALNRIKQLIVGGAPIDASLQNKLVKAPVEAYETYGMTETITHIAVKKLDKQGSNYFETLPHVKLSIDERNCLIIDAPKIATDKVVTNDVVELVGDTQFKWLGRYDSIINSGGIKLMPEKIEEKLSPLINTRFFVAGLPDETLGQKLVLVVESEATNLKELLQNIKKVRGISKYEVPKQIYFVKPFIETSTKKIDRQKTLERII
ncbi:AMP-binding protein [Flagellimonas crocea]|uniref:AMP-binding protein n=1 Tax=Flagellimonas crocea TaxID=3067311 RepID=UPI00296E49BE|nr:AMP-binding protein [Muricauda sp. DH64]